MLAKAFWIIVLLALFQFALVWALNHLPVVVLGAMSWWAWSRWNGSRGA